MKILEEGIDILKDVGSSDPCEIRNATTSEGGLPVNTVENIAVRVAQQRTC